MAGCDGTGMCSLDELGAYLQSHDAKHLLDYVIQNGSRYQLNNDKYYSIKLPSLEYQLACVFMLLGEYTIAESIHHLRWTDISTWGDKVGNDLLKHFMQEYPRD